MLGLGSWWRRVFLAAVLCLGALSSGAAAGGVARYLADQGDVLIDGLTGQVRAALLADPDRVILQVAGLGASRGMPVTLVDTAGGLLIRPRFALRAGTDYAVRLGLEAEEPVFTISLPAAQAVRPRLEGFAPVQAVIPANTLRLYLSFSTPMARGDLRRAVTLLRSDGTKVDSPFLTLGPELWDRGQTRATLLFDPGRIKQGVGPNLSHGAPLMAGERYQLVIDGSLQSAAGVSLGEDVRLSFRAGPAETRAVVPSAWQVLPPRAGSRAPLSIGFDRIMDPDAARRMIAVLDAGGQIVPGAVETDGGGWSLVPEHAWRAGEYRIRIAAALEDMSGNAVHQAFDLAQGAPHAGREAVVLPLRIAE